MKIKNITIEGMHNVVKKTYEISDFTYFFGPNGSGKSTIMQAIQLALLGYIPGTDKRKEAIFRHANTHTMAVTLRVIDDSQLISICRVWTKAGSTINSSVEILPATYDIHHIIESIELPVFNFNEFIDMTANKLKEWFIDFLPNADSEINWKSELVNSAESAGLSVNDEMLTEVIDNINEIQSTGDQKIQDVNAHFKSIVAFKKKELERSQSTIQSLIYYDDVVEEMTEEEIDATISKYEAKQKLQDEAFRAAQQNAKVEMQLKAYEAYNAESYDKDKRYIELTESIDVWNCKTEDLLETIETTNNAIEGLAENKSNLISKQSEIKASIRAKKEVIDGQGICPYTKSRCDSVMSMVDEYKKDVAELEKELDVVEGNLKLNEEDNNKWSDEIKSIRSEISSISDKVRGLENEKATIKNRYETVATLKAQLVDVPEVTVDPINYDEEINRLRNLKTKYAANKRYNDMIDILTSDKFMIEQELELYKVWVKHTDVNGLQNTASTEKFIQFAASIDKYIQAVFGPEVKTKFNLEAKANSFSFGIVRDNKYIPFNLLSSGEKCMFTLSLMLNIVELSGVNIKLLMVDDLLDHLDDINVNKLFDSLQKVSDIQMIFAGVKAVSGDYVVEVSNNG